MENFQPLENLESANSKTRRATPFLKKSSLVGFLTLLFLAYFYWLNHPCKTVACSGERRISEGGQYSYILPEGWIDRGTLGDSVFIVSPEVENGINSNIRIFDCNTQTEESRAKISEQIVSEYKGIIILGSETIKTDAGAEGSVIYSVRTNSLGIAIHRSHYILPLHPGVVVVAGTCADLYKDKYAAVFCGVAKSVRDEKKKGVGDKH
ncbi:MAG: hypothetical protein WCH86_02115 [Kiritimatiellales bacterium]